MSKLEDKLRLPDRGAGTSKNNLAKLFSRIMAKLRLTNDRLEENNRLWVRNPINRIEDDSGKRSSASGNIRKEIERPTMTWRVFEKMIRWLRPTAAKVVIILDWKDGTQTIDSINIRVDNWEPETDEEVELEQRQVVDLSNDEMMEVLRSRGVDVTYVVPGLTPPEN